MPSKKRRLFAVLIAASLAAILIAQGVLVWRMLSHLPQTVEYEDTRLMQENGWETAFAKTRDTNVGLCTEPVIKTFSAHGRQVSLSLCRINTAFAAAERLQYIEGGLWTDESALPSILLPEADATRFGISVGDVLGSDGVQYLVIGIYRSWRLPGTQNPSALAYTNQLSVEDESTMETLRIAVPLENGILESTQLYTLFTEHQLSPYGRSINLNNWAQLVCQLLPLELLAALLFPAVWLTARGATQLCRVILSSAGTPSKHSWGKALLLSLLPAALLAWLLGRVRVPGEFLPPSNLFDLVYYRQIAQGAASFVQGGYGFSAIVEQYLLVLRYMACLGALAVILGWAFAFVILKMGFFQNG